MDYDEEEEGSGGRREEDEDEEGDPTGIKGNASSFPPFLLFSRRHHDTGPGGEGGAKSEEKGEEKEDAEERAEHLADCLQDHKEEEPEEEEAKEAPAQGEDEGRHPRQRPRPQRVWEGAPEFQWKCKPSSPLPRHPVGVLVFAAVKGPEEWCRLVIDNVSMADLQNPFIYQSLIRARSVNLNFINASIKGSYDHQLFRKGFPLLLLLHRLRDGRFGLAGGW